MEQTGMFPDATERLFGSMSGLISILQVFAAIIGVMFFITNITIVFDRLKGKKEFTNDELIVSFFISIILIGIGVYRSDMISKIFNQNNQSTAAEQKVEKEKELSGEEKLKKLNVYRKSNRKNVLLADASVADQYLKYLKVKNLDKAALK